MGVAVCSASPLVVDGISALLERAGCIVLAREATLDRLSARCEIEPVTVCVIDVTPDRAANRTALEALRVVHPHLRIVALVEELDHEIRRWIEDVMIEQVLLRSARAAELVRAVQGARARSDVPAAAGRRAPVKLSPSEERVLAALCVGADTRAIATALGITDSTVRSHVRAIFHKLGVRSRPAAVLLAHSLELCVPGLPGLG